MSDLTFIAPHRISAATFAQILVRYRSPATPWAAELAEIPAAFGIDRAVALAFFVHESSAGTRGLCAIHDLKNWGNVRRPHDPTIGEVLNIPGRGSFARYPTWQDGLRDWCARIVSRYVGRGLNTVARATPVYAPSSDGNQPAAYAATVSALVARWRAHEAAPQASPLAALNIQDLRPRLRVVPSRARVARGGDPDGITLHWNGPAVRAQGDPAGELRQILGPDLDRHIGPALGADSLQYHYCVLSNGMIWQTRDLELQAWHTRHSHGNRWTLGVHLPLGEGQVATVAQWRSTAALCEALIAEFSMAGRGAVKGHMEWASTACPGPDLMDRLRAWRAGVAGVAGVAAAARRFRVIAGIDFAAIREGRSTAYPIALGGEGRLWPGAVVAADDVTDGWAHLADGRGFVHLSVLEEVA